MHAISIKAATHTRAGNDYLPGIAGPGCSKPKSDPPVYAGRVSNAKIGYSNLINWAVGLRPYKDTWFSGMQDWSMSTCTQSIAPGSKAEGSASPPYFGMQERHPELQALISCLSAGPVAPGDNIGSSNRSLIMSVCREDGVLLRPDRPAFPPTAMFLPRARGSGEVQHTHTTIGGATSPGSGRRWHFVLTFGMAKAVALSGADIRIARTEAGVAWARREGEPWAPGEASNLVRYSANRPLASVATQAPEKDWGVYTYARTAPTLCNGTGWTLLGELNKLISASPQRFTQVSGGCLAAAQSISMRLAGAPGEVVTLTLLAPAASSDVGAGRPIRLDVTIGSDGAAQAECSVKVPIGWTRCKFWTNMQVTRRLKTDDNALAAILPGAAKAAFVEDTSGMVVAPTLLLVKISAAARVPWLGMSINVAQSFGPNMLFLNAEKSTLYNLGMFIQNCLAWLMMITMVSF